MSFNRLLEDILGHRSKVALLRELLRTRKECTGRELARGLKVDPKGCRAALADLVDHGVILERRAGRAILHRVNEEHVVVRDLLEPLYGGEAALLERYAREAREGLGVPVVAVVLFGSVARGTATAKSDVDLLCIVRTSEDQRRARERLDAVTVDLARRYGSVPQVLVESWGRFRNRVVHGDRFFSELFRTGRVLFGKPLAELLKHGA